MVLWSWWALFAQLDGSELIAGLLQVFIRIGAQQGGKDLAGLLHRIDIGKLLRVQDGSGVVSVCQSGFQIGGTGAEGDLGIDPALPYGGEALIEVGVLCIILIDQGHAVEVKEDDVRVPGQDLLSVDVKSAGLAGGVSQIVSVDKDEGAVVGLSTFKAVVTLEGHAAYIDGGLVRIRDVRSACFQIGLDAVQIVGQLFCPIDVYKRQISPHTLWGDFPPKIPEDEVKPLPDADGLVVLPKPVIPEYIIVHLGKPSDQGVPNEWVLFRDYIKNVACSEIYATWARETIKANVLAIISFTLNRVYTEWYRGKGYDFTITNSTAYDQSFVPGRTIFEEISVVVDDLFNTYITREGAGQPLLTQYCDGRQTQCNGLSQWGSQALGEQGWDAISILRRYYGSDIYLAPAEKVEGVPMSFGGETLTVGSAGEDVRTIQLQLNRISENFPALPRVRADGVYGTETQEAVRTFQSIFLLPQTGDVDFATWYSISNIYVAVAKLA